MVNRAVAALGVMVVLLAGACEADVPPGQAGISEPAERSGRPNIVLFLTDDQTLAEMAVMPQTRELIGQEGVTFTRAMAQYPLCCPSRASLLTGQLPHNHGVMGNEPPWGGYGDFRTDNTLPMWLQDAGYRTALVGKLMNGYPVAGEETHVDPGWDDWYLPVIGAYHYTHFTANQNGTLVRYTDTYQTDWQADVMSQLVTEYAADDAPFFIHGSFIAPHYGGPIEPDDPPGVKTPAVAEKYRDTVTEPMPDKASIPEPDLSDKNHWWFGDRSAQRQDISGMDEVWRQRRESLKSVDDAVAQVITTLRQTGEYDDTLLVFASDNGYLMGEHGLTNQKIFGYEESIRVPLLMAGPGIPAGIVRDQLVSLVDLPATWLELAGAEPGLPQDGLPLQDFIEDPTYRSDRVLLLEAGGWPLEDEDRMYLGLRTSDDRVVIRYWNDHVETYDLAEDPFQLDGTTPPEDAAWQAEMLELIDELADCVGAEECNPALE